MRIAPGLALTTALALAAAAASAQTGPGSTDRDRERRLYAVPSAVIAAELGLGRAAREKGQWRALRDAAARGAVLLAPRQVDAAAWLNRRAEPAEPTRWQPRTVWMSCDGGYAVSRGAWSRGTASGEYLAVWQRQKKDRWKWLLRDEAAAADLGAAPEMIMGHVAECAGLPRRPSIETVALPDPANAVSGDGSLRWRVQVGPDCARTVSVEAWDGKALVPVYEARRDPPVGGCS